MSGGLRTIGSHGRSSLPACPARAAGVRSSTTKRANARASRGRPIESAWRPSRRRSERDTQITGRHGRSGEVRPTVAGAAPHIRCRPTRSGSSAGSPIHRPRQPRPRKFGYGNVGYATSASTPITSANSRICPNAYVPLSMRSSPRNASGQGSPHHSDRPVDTRSQDSEMGRLIGRASLDQVHKMRYIHSRCEYR